MKNKLLSKLIFLKNFIYFIYFSKTFSILKCRNIKRIGNGLSITLILDNKFVVKIKNDIREKNSINYYNSKYKDKISYPTNKFEFEFSMLEKLNKLNLAPKPLEYSKNYLLMEYVGLSKSFMEVDFIDGNNLIFILEQIGLLHDNDIFHPDLNLGNILFSNGKNIMFIDFEYEYLSSISNDEKVLFDFSIFCYKLYKFKQDIWIKNKALVFEYLQNKQIDIKKFILLNKKNFEEEFCNDIR